MMVRARGQLTGFKLPWKRVPGQPLLNYLEGTTKKRLDPECRLGVTAEFRFHYKGKHYKTEIIVQLQDPEKDLRLAHVKLREAIDGLVFSLTEKEINSRKVYNQQKGHYVPTTEWEITN